MACFISVLAQLYFDGELRCFFECPFALNRIAAAAIHAAALQKTHHLLKQQQAILAHTPTAHHPLPLTEYQLRSISGRTTPKNDQPTVEMAE